MPAVPDSPQDDEFPSGRAIIHRHIIAKQMQRALISYHTFIPKHVNSSFYRLDGREREGPFKLTKPVKFITCLKGCSVWYQRHFFEFTSALCDLNLISYKITVPGNVAKSEVFEWQWVCPKIFNPEQGNQACGHQRIINLDNWLKAVRVYAL